MNKRPFQPIDLDASHNMKLVEAVMADAGAGWLWVCGLLHCQRLRTDGFIAAPLLCSIAPGIADPVSTARVLCETGLWHRQDVPNGYSIHDYLDHNRSARDIERISSARAKAGAKGGRKSSKSAAKQAEKPRAEAS